MKRDKDREKPPPEIIVKITKMHPEALKFGLS